MVNRLPNQWTNRLTVVQTDNNMSGDSKIFCILTGRVDCSSENMNIVISRQYLNLLGHDGHNLYLNDPYCRPQISTQQVVFSFPIDNCGNIKKVENLSPS